MAGGDSYTLGLTLRDNQSKARDSDYKSVAYSANYDFAKPVAGMRFGFGADIESRNFASSIYAAGPREDVSVGLEMSVNFSNGLANKASALIRALTSTSLGIKRMTSNSPSGTMSKSSK